MHFSRRSCRVGTTWAARLRLTDDADRHAPVAGEQPAPGPAIRAIHQLDLPYVLGGYQTELGAAKERCECSAALGRCGRPAPAPQTLCRGLIYPSARQTKRWSLARPRRRADGWLV